MAYTSNVSGGDVAFIYRDDAIDGTYARQVNNEYGILCSTSSL